MVTNVKTKWVDGDLYFYDKSDNEIMHIDGNDRSLVLPSGAVFSCASLDLDTTEMGLLDGATAGSITASKVVTRDANQGVPLAALVVAATGSGQSTAAALTKDINLVTGADNTTAVVLPTAAVGQAIRVVNTVATANLPVYPATGAAINGGSANAAFTIGPAQEATFYCTALLTWYVEKATAVTSTPAELNILDGVTATYTELNYLDITTLGNAEASKALTFDAYNTARIGDFATGGASTGMVIFAAALDHYTDGQLDVFSGFGASTSDLTSAYSAKVGRFRHVVTTATGSVAHETYGLVGQLVTKGTTLSHLHGGLMGTFEGNTSANVLSSSYSVGHAAVVGRIGGHAVITATTPLAGFLAFNNQSAAITGGSIAAFAASVFSASYPWTYGLYLPSGSVANGASITATLTGANVIVSALAAGNATSGVRCVTTAAAPNNDYGIAGYFQSDLDGNQAGTVYGFGSWINLNSTFVASGGYVCAQDNGVWSGAGEATLTNMTVVCGMRIECILGAGTNPAAIYMFSTSIAARAFTAIVEVNAAVDLTFTTGAATTNAGKIPLFRDASASKTWYVNVYDG